MPDPRMTPDEARMYLRAYRDDRTSYIPSYAVEALETLAAAPELAAEHHRTIITRAEQIERLQKALRDMLEDFTEVDHSHWCEYYIGHLPYEPPKLSDYGLTEEDLQ